MGASPDLVIPKNKRMHEQALVHAFVTSEHLIIGCPQVLFE